MSSTPPKLAALIEYFGLAPDEDTRAQMLVEYADRFRPVPERVAHRPFPPEALVPHCESGAYVFAEPNPDGTLKFHFAVENPHGISAKAVAVMIDQSLSGAPLDQVVAVDPEFLYSIFGRGLSMGKSLGLSSMVERVRAMARSRIQAA